jgi:hypothetical protein
LRSLKHYLERHPGKTRYVAYLRRRIELSSKEAWSRLSGDRELAPWLSGGKVFDRQPTQYAAIVNDPADALFRISVEPGAPGTGQREIVIWLSAWGDHEQRVAQLRIRWTEVLRRLFPEGAAP